MRWIGVVLVFCCLGGAGFQMAHQLTRRVERLMDTGRLLGDLISLVGGQNMPTGEILCRLQRQGILPPGQWAPDVFEQYAADPLFHEEERSLIRRVGELLGSTDQQTQVRRLQLEQQVLADLTRRAVEQQQMNGRMYRWMGLLLGVLAAILLS